MTNLKHEIDINRNIRTDLALDNVDKKISKKKINVVKLKIDKHLSKIINKKSGDYLTIEFKDVTDIDNRIKVINILKKELKSLLTISPKNKYLIIGLGNNKITADSLGPRVIDKIVKTAYLDEIGLGFSNVAAYAAGVKGETGFESTDIIKALVKIYKPDVILIIDSLVTKFLERVNKTIQILNKYFCC